MPRPADVSWDRDKGAWRTDAGGRTVYFRGIAKNDRPAAREALEAHLRTLRAAVVNPGDPTVDDLARAYLRHSRRTARPRTFEGHQEMLRRFAAWPRLDSPSRYGLRRARAMKGADLVAIERAWAAEGRSPHYRARLVRSIKAAWSWAAKGDSPLLASNPMKDVPGVSVPYSRKRRVPLEEWGPFARWLWRHARQARSGFGPRDGQPPARTLTGRFGKLACLLIRFIRETGCRPGEACDLRWSDLDWPAGIASIPPERHKTGGKTGRPRVIVLTPSLVRALRAIERLEGRHDVWVFTHKRGRGSASRGAESATAGEPWESRVLAQKVRKLRDAARADGIPIREDFRLYDLRHEAASAARARGVGDDSIAVVLGTSARMIQTTYGHLTTEDLRAVAERMRGQGG